MRFEIKRINDINGKSNEKRFYISKIEYILPTGFGIFDNEKNLFVGNTKTNTPWNWSRKSIAQEIVDSFNNEGPAGELYYAVHNTLTIKK